MNAFAYVPGTAAWRERRHVKLCRETAARVQEIVDGEIGSEKAARILEKHLEACRHCHDEAEAIRALKQAICRVSGEADPQLVSKLEGLAHRLCRGGGEGS